MPIWVPEKGEGMIDRGEVIRKVILNGVRWTGLSRVYRAMKPCAGAILMLHRVTSASTSPLGFNRHLSIAPDFLDRLIGGLKADGYRFVTMDEMAARLKRGDLEGCPLALTADDAYRDNLTEALPVLERHGAPVTVYAAPAQISRRVALWWMVLEQIIARRDGFYAPVGGEAVHFDCSTTSAKRRTFIELENWLTSDVAEEDQDSLIRDLAAASGLDAMKPGDDVLMNWRELRRFAAHPLVTIGAHTVHHYNLRRLDAEAAFSELLDAADILENELGTRPRHMAFPYGYQAAVGPREADLARKAGFITAVTTRHGLLEAGHRAHLQALPRISVNGRYQSVPYIRTMLTGITTPLANRGKRLVTV